MPRVIGILGGMGPEATILLMSRILALTPADTDSDHIPLLVDNNTQVPSRIAHLVDGTGTDPTPVLIGMARRLHQAGAEALAMPCNTAHCYADQIAAAVQVPFLDMVALTATQVADTSPAGPVGLLASPAVEKTGVFATSLARHGRAVLYPDNRDAMLGAIRAIKAGHEDEALPVLQAAVAELADGGASSAILGCSEFSILAPRLGTPRLSLTDSMDVLAAACVSFALPSPFVGKEIT